MVFSTFVWVCTFGLLHASCLLKLLCLGRDAAPRRIIEVRKAAMRGMSSARGKDLEASAAMARAFRNPGMFCSFRWVLNCLLFSFYFQVCRGQLS